MSTNYPECWTDAEQVLGNLNTILFGPPGTGKTYAGLTYGEAVNQGAFRLSCTADMTEMHVTGGYMPTENGVWKWHDGEAVKAWQGDGFRGGRLVIDEGDRATGDVLSALLLVTDSIESAKWKNPETGRILTPKPGFSVVMTTNLEDLGLLDPALLDRFPARIRINRPHPKALEQLPVHYRRYADQMADAGEQRITVRQFLAVAELVRQGVPEPRAAILILGAERAQAFNEAIAVDKVA